MTVFPENVCLAQQATFNSGSDEDIFDESSKLLLPGTQICTLKKGMASLASLYIRNEPITANKDFQ